jgi:hypothetical protein
MQMQKQESQYGAPAGVYEGVFSGVAPMPGPPKIGKDGKPMGPSVEWKFTLDKPAEFAGRIVSRITSAVPTPKNGCGELLDGLVGRNVGFSENIDTDAYLNRPYRIVIGPGKEDKTKTVVTQIFALGGVPTPSANGVAPVQQPAAPAAAPAVRSFQVQVGKKKTDPPATMDEHALQAWITAEKKDPKKLQVSLAGSNAWTTAADAGFTKEGGF